MDIKWLSLYWSFSLHAKLINIIFHTYQRFDLSCWSSGLCNIICHCYQLEIVFKLKFTSLDLQYKSFCNISPCSLTSKVRTMISWLWCFDLEALVWQAENQYMTAWDSFYLNGSCWLEFYITIENLPWKFTSTVLPCKRPVGSMIVVIWVLLLILKVSGWQGSLSCWLS